MLSPNGQVTGRLMLPVLFILLLFADYSYALTTVAPVGVSHAGKTATGIAASVTYVAKGNLWAGEARYVKRTVQLGKQTVGNIIRNRAFNPLSIGVAVAITAAGYYLDQSTGEITVDDPNNQTAGQVDPGLTYIIFAHCGTSADGMTNNCPVTLDSCLFSFSHCLVEFIQTFPSGASSSKVSYVLEGTDPCIGGTYDSSTGTCGPGVPTVATDDEILADVVPLIPDSQWPNIIESPDTGAPDVVEAPEISNPFQDIIDDLESFYDVDPSTNPDTDIASGDTGIETLKTPDEQIAEQGAATGGGNNEPIDVSALSLESTQQQVKTELQTLNDNLNPLTVDTSTIDTPTVTGQLDGQFDQLETDLVAISFDANDWLNFAVIWPTVGVCTPYVMDISTNAWGSKDLTLDMCTYLQPLKDLLGWAFFISTLFFVYRITIKG